MLSPRHPLQLALGLTVWALWFTLVYGGLSLACALAPPAASLGALTWINFLLLAATLLTILLLLYWARRCWRCVTAENRSTRMIAWTGTALHTVAAVATAGVGLPIIFLPPCV